MKHIIEDQIWNMIDALGGVDDPDPKAEYRAGLRRDWRATCHDHNVWSGQQKLPGVVSEVAGLLADGHIGDAIQAAGSDSDVINALGMRPVPIPERFRSARSAH